MDLNVDFDLSDSDETIPLPNDSNIATHTSLPGTSYDVLVDTPSGIAFNKPVSKDNNKSKRTLETWTDEQKNVTSTFFSNHILKSLPPKKHECLALRKQRPVES